MNNLIIAVDVGRSTVKAKALYKGSEYLLSFPSIYSESWSKHSDPNSSFVSLRTQDTQEFFTDIATGIPHLFGDTAIVSGERPITFSESNGFHKFSCHAVLFAVVYFFNKIGQIVPFDLALNLTYSNSFRRQEYADFLKRKHHLEAFGKKWEFNISSLFCFEQGHAALFQFLKTDTPVEKKIQTSKGIIIDIGRYTLDLSIIDKFTLVKGVSTDLGTETFLQELKREVDPIINLSVAQLDHALVNPNTVYTNLYGSKVQVNKLSSYNKALSRQSDKIIQFIQDTISNESVDYIYYVGGGSILFKSFLDKVLKAYSFQSESIFANVDGMTNFLKVVV